jgi:hypothetical protein
LLVDSPGASSMRRNAWRMPATLSPSNLGSGRVSAPAASPAPSPPCSLQLAHWPSCI